MKVSYLQPHTLESTSENSREIETHTGYPNLHCKLLQDMGYECELIVLTSESNKMSSKHEKYGHVIHHFPVSIGKNFGKEFSYSLIKYLITSDSDLVHIRGYKQYNILPILPLLSRYKPVVVQHLGTAGEYELRSIKTRVALKLLDHADLVAALDANEISKLQSSGFPENKLFHLPDHGVDPEIFHPISKTEAKKELGLNQNCLTITYVGRITSIKNVPTLVKAIGEIKDEYNIELIICGDGPESEMNKVQSTIKNENISETVKVVGHVPHHQLLYYYNSSDVCVFPSEVEGLGLVVLEAGACETAIVGTEAHSSKVFQDKYNILKINNITADSISNSILELLNNKEYRETMAKNMRQDILEYYSTTAVQPRVKEAYNKAIENHQSS